jgi:hypothetical protein
MYYVASSRDSLMRRRDFDELWPPTQVPEMRGGRMRCDRSRTRAENRNRHGSLPGGRRTRKQVDAGQRSLPMTPRQLPADLVPCGSNIERRLP